MKIDLSGKKVLIGGSSKGIGLGIAKQLAEGPAVAFRYMKENLNRAVSGEVDDCLDLEVTHHVHCGQTEDHKNASKAFVEKKQPVFKGR